MLKYFRFFVVFCMFLAMTKQGAVSENVTNQTKQIYHNTQQGDWFTRVRGLYILPVDSSGAVDTIPGSGVSVHSSWTGEFDFGYMFTKNLGSELILGICRNTLVGKGSLEGKEIGTTWLLPPTLTIQWRFIPSYIVQPYVGAGINYTLYYNIKSALKNTKVQLEHSWGPALQGGVDIFFYKNWFINADIKFIWMDTHATLSGAVNGKVHVHVNPFVFGIGIGCKW